MLVHLLLTRKDGSRVCHNAQLVRVEEDRVVLKTTWGHATFVADWPLAYYHSVDKCPLSYKV